MNIKLRINKILGSGLWWQVLLFVMVNIAVFTFFRVTYSLFIDSNDGYFVSLWDSIRLFVDSNSVLDDHPSSEDTIWLLIMECLGTILFSGLIVSIITNVISQKVDAIKEGHVHYKLKNHVVIIGYDSIVPSIMSEIISDSRHKESRIILQTCDSIEEVRCTLRAKLSTSDLDRVILIHAPRQSTLELRLLHTINAREIFIVGDRTQSDHDAENMHTFEELVAIHRQQGATQSKPLMIWFENEASYAALQLNDISKEWKDYFEFRPYNFYKRWANRLLTSSSYGTEYKKIIYPELDCKGIDSNSTKHVHLIIVGMNRMGIALAKEAAHLLHFPNFDELTGANRTRITFIDDHADREMDFFMGRLPGYFNVAHTKYKEFLDNECVEIKSSNKGEFLDVQFEFIKGRVESGAVREWLKEELKDDDAIISIAICIENPSQSFGMAMYLPEEVYTRGRNKAGTPWDVEDEYQIVNIFVRQEATGSLIKAFGDAAKSNSAKNKRYANMYPFGMVDESFSLNYYSNHLAMALNFIYDYYFNHNKTLPSSLPSIDDLTKIWKKLPISHQWSNLYLADSIEFKLRSMGLNKESAQYATISDEQIEDLARTEHNRWNMEKLLLGYRTLTEEESQLNAADKKTLKNKLFAHHLIMPYWKLDDEDKELDRYIIRKMPDIIRMVND